MRFYLKKLDNSIKMIIINLIINTYQIKNRYDDLS